MQPQVAAGVHRGPWEQCGLVTGGGAQLRVRRIGALMPYLENDPGNKRPNATTTASLDGRPLGQPPNARSAAATCYAAPISTVRLRKGVCEFPCRLWQRRGAFVG